MIPREIQKRRPLISRAAVAVSLSPLFAGTWPDQPTKSSRPISVNDPLPGHDAIRDAINDPRTPVNLALPGDANGGKDALGRREGRDEFRLDPPVSLMFTSETRELFSFLAIFRETLDRHQAQNRQPLAGPDHEILLVKGSESVRCSRAIDLCAQRSMHQHQCHQEQ